MISWPIGGAGKKRVLFYAESPVKYAMFRPVQELMLPDDRVRFWFTGQLRGTASAGEMARSLGVTGATPIRRGLSALARFDAFVTADYDLWSGFDNDRLPIATAPRVQLFHGVSVRNGAIQKKMLKYRRLFSVGPYMTRRFVESGILEDGDPRLTPVGMPKTDRFFDGSQDAEATRRELGLDPSKPTVMLAPTWLRHSPMTAYGEALIERLAAGPWNLIVKLHDKFFDPRFNVVDWRERLAPLGAREGCAVLVDEYDAVPYLWIADLLISDVSSIANEFALLDRPLVYLEVDEEEKLAAQYPNLDLETWGQRAGATAASAEACVAAVEAGLSDPAARSEFRRALAEDLFYNRGSASPVAAAALYDVLELDLPSTLAAALPSPA